MLQICSQSTKLIKHVHQNLTMSYLNGHDSLQCTTNVKVIRSKRWRNSNNSSTNKINRRLTRSSTCRRGRRGCSTRRLNSRTFRALSLSYEQPFAQEKWHLWKQLCVRAQKQGSHLTLKTIKSYE